MKMKAWALSADYRKTAEKLGAQYPDLYKPEED